MKIGVSACLLGSLCRYDGGHSKDDFIVNILDKYFEFVPYCPETAIFGSPRETIRLVQEESIKAYTSKTNKDITRELQDISNESASMIKNDNLCGFILKSKSPTCGLERVKVYEKDTPFNTKKGIGFFAKSIKEKYPNLPVEEEGRLNDPWLRENFLMQIFAYKSLYTFLQTKPSLSKLVDFHTTYKYLIYAKSHTSYKSLGHIVANREKKELEEILEQYKNAFEIAIAQKGSINNTYNVLLHIFGYFKKHISKEEKKDILELIEDFKIKIVPLIAVIKVLSLYTNRLDISYLKTQVFLNPYPKELALRSDMKAYK